MNLVIVADWIWREHFEYNIDGELPEGWKQMDNQAKLEWAEQFDCTSMDSYPIEFVQVVEVEEVY